MSHLRNAYGTRIPNALNTVFSDSYALASVSKCTSMVQDGV